MATIKIGDIFEIKTPKGFAYGQYTHKIRKSGSVVRILPGLHGERPKTLRELAQGPTKFVVQFPLKYAASMKLVAIVANEPVPEHAKDRPIFRGGTPDSTTGIIKNWWFTDGEKSWRVGEISQEQRRMPLTGIPSLPLLIERIVIDWTPEKDPYGFGPIPRASVEEEPPNEKKGAGESLEHYLYFPLRENAQRAAQELASEGFRVEVRLGADQENWLVLARHATVPIEVPIEQVRNRLERLAINMGGEYDGWEVKVE